jgi:SAM-dependent methyltransferase
MNQTSTPQTSGVLDQLQSLPQKFKKSVGRRGWLGTLDLCLWKVGDYLANWLLPSRYRARRLDREFDARFGVETRGIIPLSGLHIESDNLTHGIEYEQSKPMEFYHLLRMTRAKYEDFIFVDLGSGKGRALMLASEFPFKKIVGVEFAAELHQIAQENIRKFHSPTQRCANFELLHLDAAVYSIPPEKVIFYMYNPFREEVMERALTNIQRSLTEYPREVFIIYCNAVHRNLVRRFGFSVVGKTRWHVIYKGNAQ